MHPNTPSVRTAMTIEMRGAVMATSPAVKAAQVKGEGILRKKLGDEKADALIENRKKRDGDKAHITLMSPADTKQAIATMAASEGIPKGEAERRIKEVLSKGLPDSYDLKGVGKAESGGKEAYYVAIDWPAADAFRAEFGLPTGSQTGAQHFHITLGFGDGGDVHGVAKKDTSVGRLASLRSKVIRLAHAKPALRPHLLPLLVGKD